MLLDLRSLWEVTATSFALSIDTPGAITYLGQSIAANTGVAQGTAGAIGYAGQTTAFGIGLASTEGAITYAGQSLSFNDNVAVSSAGAINYAGQNGIGLNIVTPYALTIDGSGLITFAGQELTISAPFRPKLYRHYRGYDSRVKRGDKKGR